MPNATEIIFNDVMYAENNGGFQIRAGQMVVLPSAWCNVDISLPEIDGDEVPPFPEFLLVCAGQTLIRANYLGWNSEYQGGFYDFTLPNLHEKFIMGFDEDGEPILGSGCVYFKDIPEIPKPMPHDVRQMT